MWMIYNRAKGNQHRWNYNWWTTKTSKWWMKTYWCQSRFHTAPVYQLEGSPEKVKSYLTTIPYQKTWVLTDTTHHMGVSIHGDIPDGWFIMEHPIKMDDLGLPLFQDILGHLHLGSYLNPMGKLSTNHIKGLHGITQGFKHYSCAPWIAIVGQKSHVGWPSPTRGQDTACQEAARAPAGNASPNILQASCWEPRSWWLTRSKYNQWTYKAMEIHGNVLQMLDCQPMKHMS